MRSNKGMNAIYTYFSSFTMNFREINYYMSKGRAIRRIVTLFDNIEDLIGENDRRCDLDSEDENVTLE
jgi:hypothetical protein